jgi:hypothetical protein
VPSASFTTRTSPVRCVQPEREGVPEAVRRVPAADPGAAQPELEAALRLACGKRIAVARGEHWAAASVADPGVEGSTSSGRRNTVMDAAALQLAQGRGPSREVEVLDVERER